MKIAAAAYPLGGFTDWDGYAAKITAWVAEAAGAGAELLVFPEYGAMELAYLEGPEAAADAEASVTAVSDRLDRALALHRDLAQRHGVHILMGSGPARETSGRVVNRAHLIAPTGQVGVQDKQVMTRFEREEWCVAGGGPLQLFDTALGRIGVLICYDSEFPLLGRALADVDWLLVPSATEALSGYWRVRIGAMSRALEGQCVSVMASLVGSAPGLYAMEENTGAGGVFGPPDKGFPADGVLAAGPIGQPGWTYAEADLQAIAEVRRDGVVANRRHWDDQIGRDGPPALCRLRD